MINPNTIVRLRLVEDIFSNSGAVYFTIPQSWVTRNHQYLDSLPIIELLDREAYLIDTSSNMIFYAYDPQHAWEFASPQDLTQFLERYEETGMAARHVFTPQVEPAEIPAERKAQHKVWEDDRWMILKLPAEVDFIHREGFDMSHCLGHYPTAVDYCKRMAESAQDQYSLVDKQDGKPRVNFEVSHSRSSYGGPVDEPTITQIRGHRNQCPPADEYLYPLMAFFAEHPDWRVSGHGVRSFDGGVDGDKVVARWNELQAGQ